jgi:hypothetical protein
MANYFPVVLTGTARSWLMNLHEGNLTSWHELCCQFMVNFESAYSRPGNETDLHTIQQHRGGGRHYALSSSSFPRFTTPFLISPMLLLWLDFASV